MKDESFHTENEQLFSPEMSTELMDVILKHQAVSYNEIELMRLKGKFSKHGFVKLSKLVTDEIKQIVRNEVISLANRYSERRDIILKTTGNTPRHLNIVRSHFISQNAKIIPTLSRSEKFLKILEYIAGEKFYPSPEKDEEFVITKQVKAGDTHGWHWGNFSFALIWVIETPPVEFGGMLQCVPHTFWHKSDPQVFQNLCDNQIETHKLETGDIYLLKTDTTLHRTVPLTIDGVTRIILNMTWGNLADTSKDMKFDDRWWDNTSAKEASLNLSKIEL